MPILRWLGREEHVKTAETVPYRLLEADDALSAGDPETPNMLIQGDNLEALKAVLPYYAGRVKCISIDPPYNTRSAFGPEMMVETSFTLKFGFTPDGYAPHWPYAGYPYLFQKHFYGSVGELK